MERLSDTAGKTGSAEEAVVQVRRGAPTAQGDRDSVPLKAQECPAHVSEYYLMSTQWGL